MVTDWDDSNRTLRVLGKGNKYRTVYLGMTAVKALSGYLRRRQGQPTEPLFLNSKGRPFTASGLYQLIERLSFRAGVPNPGVHALRRTFAVNMLRAGANVFTVQTLLGHSTLDMTRRYCQVAEADCEEQHRKYSPADRMPFKS
jgi:site-specific recombinase XerD